MTKFLIFLLLSLLLFISCDKSDHPTPLPEERTVIVYMIADNNLNSQTNINIEELLAGTTKEKLNNGNLVVYLDGRVGKPRIIEISVKDGNVDKTTVEKYEEQNSADPNVMKSVLKDIATLYPTKHYGLVLWSHGSAWIPKDAENMIKTRSFGDDNSNVMDIDVLAEALSDGLHYDFILFDACYMGNIEVAYELKDVTDYIIASPMEIMAKGFPYENIVGDLFSIPANLQGICAAFYDYYNQYDADDDNRTASVSLVQTNNLEKLASTLKTIIRNHNTELSKVELSKLQQLEYYHSKRLLYDLDEYIKTLATDSEYTNFKNDLSKVILYEAHTPRSFFAYPYKSFDIEKCSGLTVYPMGFNPELDKWYERLEWYKVVYQ